MCGIVGYIGPREASEFLLEGLRRLEYRGYDSAGIAVVDAGEIGVSKSTGRVATLGTQLLTAPLPGHVGIGHTRWATHGAANDSNAHPHVGGLGDVTVVHNGVIENFAALREELESEGYVFRSETDSEVIGHLIARNLEKHSADVSTASTNSPHAPLVAAVRTALARLQGTYGLVVLFRDFPDVMIAARLGSPLVVGVGQGEHFVASDALPLAGYTEKIVYLTDHQLAVVTTNSLRVTHR